MNAKILMKYIAAQLPTQGVSLNWIIRGEADSESVDENKNMIAVTHCINQEEIVYGNFSYKLQCALTGQILLNALTPEEVNDEVSTLFNALATYIKSLRYTDCDGAIVMDATCGMLSTETDELYYSFSIPFTLFAQF